MREEGNKRVREMMKEERRGTVGSSWERGKRAMTGPVERGSRVEGGEKG